MFIQPMQLTEIGITFNSDTLRLLLIFAFIYGSVLDYRTRRVYNEFWVPLIGLCFIVLGWDIAMLIVSPESVQAEFLFSFSLSILLVPSLAFLLWENGFFGGADLKAIAFLSVFFPVVPEYTVNGTTYPVVDGISPIFTITIVVNALLLSALYRVYLTGVNITRGDISPLLTRAVKHNTSKITDLHGDIIFETSTGDIERLDIDVLRMYLQWRGITLTEFRSNHSFYENTNPVNTNRIGDGSIPHTYDTPLGRSDAQLRYTSVERRKSIIPINNIDTQQVTDPWAVDQFIRHADIERQSSVNVHTLQSALESISQSQRVWVSPAIPFFIPLTIGLIIAIAYGSLFIGMTNAVTEFIVTTFL